MKLPELANGEFPFPQQNGDHNLTEIITKWKSKLQSILHLKGVKNFRVDAHSIAAAMHIHYFLSHTIIA